jgi:CRP-like cAMP-binding protein
MDGTSNHFRDAEGARDEHWIAKKGRIGQVAGRCADTCGFRPDRLSRVAFASDCQAVVGREHERLGSRNVTTVELPEREEEPGQVAPDATTGVTADTIRRGAGPWQPPRGVSLLVLDGIVLRDVEVGTCRLAELIGRGDVISAEELEEGEPSVPATVGWTVLEPILLAVLDQRLLTTFAMSPSMLESLLSRAIRRVHRLAVQLAIVGQVGVEQRLILMLWLLADRWGRVTRDGVFLPIQLSHRVLAQIVGARRPTVTTALRRLAAKGTVERAAGGWLLRSRPEWK